MVPAPATSPKAGKAGRRGVPKEAGWQEARHLAAEGGGPADKCPVLNNSAESSLHRVASLCDFRENKPSFVGG